jgi:DNA polymerase III epsilon subunit-like protein
MTRYRLATIAFHVPAAPEQSAAPVAELAERVPALGQTASGILLPPGVADKLSARAAIAEAVALVDSLPLRPAEDALLAEVKRLADQVAALSTALVRAEQRVAGIEHKPATPQLATYNLRTFQPSPAAQALLDRDPLFLDLETTGLKKVDHVVEVGIIDAQGQVLFSSLVNPDCPIPANASEVNGVYDADVADAPAWPEVLPLLRRLLANRTVVAHNAKFEAKFLPADWSIDWVCSKKLADSVLGKREGMGSLTVRLKQLGLLPGPAHSAAGDCLSTLRLVRSLAGETSPVELRYH